MTRRYVTPPRTRIYAIGDLHGHRAPLRAMMDKITEDVRGRHIETVSVVFLGDYIDKGPDSAGMIEDLIGLQKSKIPAELIFLRGNHESGILKFIDHPEGPWQDWLDWGGVETLKSYDVEINSLKPAREQAVNLAAQLNHILPSYHRNFLKNLPLYHRCGDYLFVHAGVRPHFALEEQKERDLLCIRNEFLKYEGVHPWRVVHGHTITEEPEILHNRINVDTGFYQHGVLSCAVLEGDQVEILQVRA